jgi:hypothetical protein
MLDGFNGLRAEMLEGFKDLRGKYDSLKGEIVTAHKWAIALYLALLGVIAHGFKWF